MVFLDEGFDYRKDPINDEFKRKKTAKRRTQKCN